MVKQKHISNTVLYKVLLFSISIVAFFNVKHTVLAADDAVFSDIKESAKTFVSGDTVYVVGYGDITEVPMYSEPNFESPLVCGVPIGRCIRIGEMSDDGYFVFVSLTDMLLNGEDKEFSGYLPTSALSKEHNNLNLHYPEGIGILLPLSHDFKGDYEPDKETGLDICNFFLDSIQENDYLVFDYNGQTVINDALGFGPGSSNGTFVFHVMDGENHLYSFAGSGWGMSSQNEDEEEHTDTTDAIPFDVKLDIEKNGNETIFKFSEIMNQKKLYGEITAMVPVTEKGKYKVQKGEEINYIDMEEEGLISVYLGNTPETFSYEKIEESISTDDDENGKDISDTGEFFKSIKKRLPWILFIAGLILFGGGVIIRNIPDTSVSKKVKKSQTQKKEKKNEKNNHK